MKNNLFFTVSGLRGIVGESFTPELVARISAHFGNFLGEGEIIVGRDTRKSGEMVKFAVISGLLSSGCIPFDIGVVPTPTVLFAVRERGSKGGIAVTASHNPPEWNALKFIKGNGTFLRENEISLLKKMLEKEPVYKRANEIKGAKEGKFLENHINAVLESQIFNIREIERKGFRVAVDAANGAASFAVPLLCERMGCRVIRVNCDRPGEFEREVEPTSENLYFLQSVVKEKGADIGFATDADGDRLVIVLKGGEVLSEEHTLPLFVHYILSKTKISKPVVTNYSTSKMVEEVAERFGVKVKRTKVGESFVVEKMEEEESILGGEGNGGVIYREINFTRDALIGIAGILSLLSETEDSREFKKIVPKFYMKKIKIPLRDLNYDNLIENFKPENIVKEDGLLLNFKDGFLHVRPSNTEPVIRIIAEFVESERLEYMMKKIFSLLK